MHLISGVCVACCEFPGAPAFRMKNYDTDQPPLMHIIRTTHLKFLGHITRVDPSMDRSRALRSSVASLLGGRKPEELPGIALGAPQHAQQVDLISGGLHSPRHGSEDFFARQQPVHPDCRILILVEWLFSYKSCSI